MFLLFLLLLTFLLHFHYVHYASKEKEGRSHHKKLYYTNLNYTNLNYTNLYWGSHLDPVWIPFGSHLDTIWIPFGSHLDPILDTVWIPTVYHFYISRNVSQHEKAVALYRKVSNNRSYFYFSKSKRLRQKLSERNLRIMRIRTAAQDDEAFVTKFVQHLSAYTAGRSFAVLGTDDRNRNEVPHTL